MKGVWIKLDLTKKRYNILRSTRSIVDENQDVNYVFADINCRLKIVFKDGTSDFFEDITELNERIENAIMFFFFLSFFYVLSLKKGTLRFAFIISFLQLLNIFRNLWQYFFLFILTKFNHAFYKSLFTFRFDQSIICHY